MEIPCEYGIEPPGSINMELVNIIVGLLHTCKDSQYIVLKFAQKFSSLSTLTEEDIIDSNPDSLHLYVEWLP